MDKKVNLDQILKDFELDSDKVGIVTNLIIQHAIKETCKQTLELVAENIKVMIKDGYTGKICSEYNDHYPIFDKQSILDTINQIK